MEIQRLQKAGPRITSLHDPASYNHARYSHHLLKGGADHGHGGFSENKGNGKRIKEEKGCFEKVSEHGCLEVSLN